MFKACLKVIVFVYTFMLLFFILAAIQKKFKNTTDSEIQNAIGNVLKHAPDRKDGGDRKLKLVVDFLTLIYLFRLIYTFKTLLKEN